MSKEKEIEFKKWWDEKYFRTEGTYRPLYNVFVKLDKPGVDLDTIERLCNCLRLGDLFVDLILSERTKGKRRSLLAVRAEEMRPSEIFGIAFSEFLIPHLLHTCWSRGRKVDMWGSLFVYLVTEYMRSVCGKPHGRLADELLRAVRGQLGLPSNASINRDGRRRVEDRIKKLKMAHADWQKHPPTEQSAFLRAFSRFIALELGRRRRFVQ